MVATRQWSIGLIVLGAAAGGLLAIIDYTTRSSGIAGTPGALLVVGSSIAVLVAALVLPFLASHVVWLARLLSVLILLGILGTALAAYMLESQWLVLAMAVSLIGWLARLTGRQAVAAAGA